MKLNEIKQVTEGSGPKEKQKTPYRDINSPTYRDAADALKQRIAKDKAAAPGKKLLSKKKVTEGYWGWDDPRYDSPSPARSEDDEYDRYRQSKLDDEAEAEKKPTGFQVYDGTTRQYIGKVFRTQAEAVKFRADHPNNRNMSIQIVPLK